MEVRRVAVIAEDPIWAGAVVAALNGAGIEVVRTYSGLDNVSPDRFDVLVAAGTEASLRTNVGAIGQSIATLAIGPDNMALMLDLLEEGALGYLPQETAFDEIAGAVGQLLEGHAVVPPAALGTLLRRVVERRRARSADRETLDQLTDRELEVFKEMAKGHDNAAIAVNLFISPATARTHLQRVYKKLGVHSRAGAVAFAARCGLDIEGDG